MNKCTRCGEVNPAEIHTCSPQKNQEPVAWMYDFPNPDDTTEIIRDWVAQSLDEVKHCGGVNVRPLYAAPPQREWQGLGTDEEILELSKDAWGRDKLTDGRTDLTGFYVDFARLIEKLLQEKNT